MSRTDVCICGHEYRFHGGPHLHLEGYDGERFFNPIPYSPWPRRLWCRKELYWEGPRSCECREFQLDNLRLIEDTAKARGLI